MNIKGHGIDICEIARIKQTLEGRVGDHFVERMFSEVEIAYCKRHADPYPSFAARFAAKEAYGKATGLGLGPSGNFTEIEVQHDEKGAPFLVLRGKALALFQEMGFEKIFLSLSHDGAYAFASVILC